MKIVAYGCQKKTKITCVHMTQRKRILNNKTKPQLKLKPNIKLLRRNNCMVRFVYIWERVSALLPGFFALHFCFIGCPVGTWNIERMPNSTVCILVNAVLFLVFLYSFALVFLYCTVQFVSIPNIFHSYKLQCCLYYPSVGLQSTQYTVQKDNGKYRKRKESEKKNRMSANRNVVSGRLSNIHLIKCALALLYFRFSLLFRSTFLLVCRVWRWNLELIHYWHGTAIKKQ